MWDTLYLAAILGAGFGTGLIYVEIVRRLVNCICELIAYVGTLAYQKLLKRWGHSK